MKTLEELMAIKARAEKQMNVREEEGAGIRIVVGARPVLGGFVEEVAKRGLKNVSVNQTGCIGMCQYEPIVEVFEEGKEKVTYIKMTPEKVARVVADHIVNGNPVVDYTVASLDK